MPLFRKINTLPKADSRIWVDGITEKKQLLLLKFRNQTNELLSLGIDPLLAPSLTKKTMKHRRLSNGRTKTPKTKNARHPACPLPEPERKMSWMWM